METIFGNTFDMTKKSMDYLWQKQTVIANNISNNDTPGFKAQRLAFEDIFRRNLEKAAGNGSPLPVKQAIERSPILLQNTDAQSTRLDGNNVQIEAEYIEQARAVLQYQYQVKSMTSNFAQLQTAIKG